jgi:hypothetical protein
MSNVLFNILILLLPKWRIICRWIWKNMMIKSLVFIYTKMIIPLYNHLGIICSFIYTNVVKPLYRLLVYILKTIRYVMYELILYLTDNIRYLFDRLCYALPVVYDRIRYVMYELILYLNDNIRYLFDRLCYALPIVYYKIRYVIMMIWPTIYNQILVPVVRVWINMAPRIWYGFHRSVINPIYNMVSTGGYFCYRFVLEVFNILSRISISMVNMFNALIIIVYNINNAIIATVYEAIPIGRNIMSSVWGVRDT